MSSVTKRLRFQNNLLFFLHFLLPALACVVSLILALTLGDFKTSKAVIPVLIFIGILALFNILKKVKLTCIPFLFIIAAYLIFTEIIEVIFIIALYTVLDDFIFRGLYYKKKTEYLASKIDDKREAMNG